MLTYYFGPRGVGGGGEQQNKEGGVGVGVASVIYVQSFWFLRAVRLVFI